MDNKQVSSAKEVDGYPPDFGSGMFSDRSIILYKIKSNKPSLFQTADLRKCLWEITA